MRNSIYVIHLRGEVFKCAACMWLQQPCLHISLTHLVFVEFSPSFLVYGVTLRVVQRSNDWRWYTCTTWMISNSSSLTSIFICRRCFSEYSTIKQLVMFCHIISIFWKKAILCRSILCCDYYLRNCTHTTQCTHTL